MFIKKGTHLKYLSYDRDLIASQKQKLCHLLEIVPLHSTLTNLIQKVLTLTESELAYSSDDSCSSDMMSE